MMNSKTLFSDFINSLALDESQAEIESIAYLAFENVLGLNRTQVLTEKKVTNNDAIVRLQHVAQRLNEHEPIQYILGEAVFYGRKFIVNPSVLIPRPETEELARLVIDHVKKKSKNLRITDIGTGSGCVAVTLSLELPGSYLIATDVSSEALAVANANSRTLNASVRLVQHDILNEDLPFATDIIVSNPPYIAEHERSTMPRNVVDFEPRVALFVNDNDPFLFYHALISRANKSLRSEGLLAVEINERYGKEIADLFNNSHFRDVEVVKDMYGKDRIVKGILS